MDSISYGGFYIDKPLGNNIFSYEERKERKIYVPQLIESEISSVSIGSEAVFIEIDEGIENKCIGLAKYV